MYHCLQECLISNCGELGPGEDDGVLVDETGDNYPTFPDDATDVDFKDVSMLAACTKTLLLICH